MRLVLLEQVRLPATLARTIYDDEGKTILTKGTLLNDCYLNRLKELDVRYLYVDEGLAHMEVDEIASEEVRQLAVRTAKETLLKVRAGESLESRNMRIYIVDLLQEIMLDKEVMVHLIDIFSLKDHTFAHSVNVCALSLLTGLAMGYNYQQLRELAIGALLHDIGKATVIDCIVNSKHLFAIEEHKIMQKHAECGYQLLIKADKLPASAAEVAWQHHERCNGTGYPEGLKKEEISEFARVVAVVDVYEALSTDRPYRKRFGPHEVMKIIKSGEGVDFDSEITAAFLGALIPFPLGSHVILNDGSEGIVVSIDKSFSARPRVQLIGHNGQEIKDIRIIDLLQKQQLFISRVVRSRL